MSQRSRRIPRAIWGYRPAAARRMLAELEERCAREEQRLTGRLEELRSGNGALRRLAEAAGLGGLSAHLPLPAPADGPGVGEADFQGLGMAFLGYQPGALRARLASLREEWGGRLKELRGETRRLESEREAVLSLIGAIPRPHTPPSPGDPVLEMAAAVTVLPLPPANLPSPGRSAHALRLAPANPTAPRRGGGHRWRPGAVEDEEGSAPAESGVKRPGTGGRIQPVRAALPDQDCPAPDQPSQAPAGPAVQSAEPSHGPATAGRPGAEQVKDPRPQVEGGVRQRIEILFQRFLAGKVLGADLVTGEGELLAVRGTAITYELMQKAEAAGLLPSLIANMTLPGMTGE